MKKTLVALAVAAVAASASATTVYNQDGTKVDIGGRLDVMVGKFNKDERTDLRNNESRIEFNAEHDLGDGFKALAFSRFRFNEGGDRWDTNTSFNNINLNKLWLGFEAADVGRVTFGKQDTTGDALQMNDSAYIFGGNNNVLDGGDKVVSFRSADFQVAEGQTLGFGADYVFGQSDKYALTADLKNGYGASLFYAGQFGDFGAKFNAGYTVAKYDDTNALTNDTGKQEKSWRVASRFSYGPVEFGAEYGQTNVDASKTQKAGKGSFVEVAAKYQYLEGASIYAAWERNQYKGDVAGLDASNFLRTGSKASAPYVANGEKLTEYVYILGTDYQFNKHVVGYVEYAHSRVKGTGAIGGADVTVSGDTERAKDNRFGVGVRVYF